MKTGHIASILLLAAALLAAGPATRGDADSAALLEAKRRTAMQLSREGKDREAAALLAEITASDSAVARDFLSLAKVQEKLSRTPEALEAYRRVMSMLPAGSASQEERATRAEAQARIKLLDPLGPKIELALDKFTKDLAALEREAEQARNVYAMNRLWRIRGGLSRAESSDERIFAVVTSDWVWQDTGMRVVAGQKYRVRALGGMRLAGDVECDANGVAARPANAYGTVGRLIGLVANKVPVISLGADMEFVAQASGPLQLAANLDGVQGAEGAYRVVIERQ
jgi:hypothetical protein